MWCRRDRLHRARARRRGGRRRRARSPSRAGRCATCARWSSGSSGPATPPRSAGSATCPTGERRRALADAAAWRSTETERGFSMALGRVVDPPTPTASGWSPGRMGSCAPSCSSSRGATDGMSLDLMRRDRTADPGVNELLIVARAARRPGAGRQPGVAELRRLPLRPRAGRAARRRPGACGPGAGSCSSPRAGSRSSPSTGSTPSSSRAWEPRFVVYPHTADLPAGRHGRARGRGVPHLALAAPADQRCFA